MLQPRKNWSDQVEFCLKPLPPLPLVFSSIFMALKACVKDEAPEFYSLVLSSYLCIDLISQYISLGVSIQVRVTKLPVAYVYMDPFCLSNKRLDGA